MASVLTCPKCHGALVSELPAGKPVKCPRCAAVFTPAAQPAAAGVAKPAAPTAQGTVKPSAPTAQGTIPKPSGPTPPGTAPKSQANGASAAKPPAAPSAGPAAAASKPPASIPPAAAPKPVPTSGAAPRPAAPAVPPAVKPAGDSGHAVPKPVADSAPKKLDSAQGTAKKPAPDSGQGKAAPTQDPAVAETAMLVDKLVCPSCHAIFKLTPPRAVGLTLKCPGCHKPVTISAPKPKPAGDSAQGASKAPAPPKPGGDSAHGTAKPPKSPTAESYYGTSKVPVPASAGGDAHAASKPQSPPKPASESAQGTKPAKSPTAESYYGTSKVPAPAAGDTAHGAGKPPKASTADSPPKPASDPAHGAAKPKAPTGDSQYGVPKVPGKTPTDHGAAKPKAPTSDSHYGAPKAQAKPPTDPHDPSRPPKVAAGDSQFGSAKAAAPPRPAAGDSQHGSKPKSPAGESQYGKPPPKASSDPAQGDSAQGTVQKPSSGSAQGTVKKPPTGDSQHGKAGKAPTGGSAHGKAKPGDSQHGSIKKQEPGHGKPSMFEIPDEPNSPALRAVPTHADTWTDEPMAGTHPDELPATDDQLRISNLATFEDGIHTTLPDPKDVPVEETKSRRPGIRYLRPKVLAVWAGAAVAGLVLFLFFKEKGGGEIPETEWFPFTPPQGHCQVMMPGLPLRQGDPLAPAKQFVVNRKEHGSYFNITYVNVEGRVLGSKALDDIYQQQREELAEYGKVIRETDLNLNGHAGKEMVVDAPGDRLLITRVYLVEGRYHEEAYTRLYVLRAEGKWPTVNAPAPTRFFESFRVPPKAMAQAK